MLIESNDQQFEAQIKSAPGAVLVMFYMANCPACKQMQPIVQQLAQAGQPVLRVDAVANRALQQVYGIQRAPVFVIIKDGLIYDRVEGGTSLQDLQQRLASAS